DPAPGVAGRPGGPPARFRAWGRLTCSETRARGGCRSAGNRRDRCPGERPASLTLPSAAHFCETPPDLRFCLDFQVNRRRREGCWSQPRRRPELRHVIPATGHTGRVDFVGRGERRWKRPGVKAVPSAETYQVPTVTDCDCL